MKSSSLIIVSIVLFVVITSLVLLYPTFTNQQLSSMDMNRKHGTVDTTMGSPTMGSQNAKITIIEFGDYQCPNCKKWFLETKPQIIENLIQTNKANLIFIDITFLGKDSIPSAIASYCAEEQGKYWEYHSILYSNQEGIDTGWASNTNLKQFASELGLDMELFNSCLDSEKFEKRVSFNTEQARINGVRGTPTFIIVDPEGDQKTIVGPQPYPVFKNIVEEMI
jgi:protein-disulfide isomerase